MNDDALAAVVAAAQLLLARAADTSPAPPSPSWPLAARLPAADGAQARLVARARSRWAMSGRLRD
jgi:hypothetical protein